MTSYVVVETREVVDYMRHAELQAPPVRYQTMEEPMDTADLLYCKSVLQYFGTNDPLLSLVDRIQPHSILLEDLVGRSGEDFFTTQIFRGSAIPYRFLGLQVLLDDLAAQVYFVLVRNPYPSPVKGVVGPMPMENFPPTMQLRYSSSILLKREYPK